jgi:hypothetical protein
LSLGAVEDKLPRKAWVLRRVALLGLKTGAALPGSSSSSSSAFETVAGPYMIKAR